MATHADTYHCVRWTVIIHFSWDGRGGHAASLWYSAYSSAEPAACPAWHGARYLLEFGEVSNSYNFTVPNMLLHIGVTVTLSTLSWLWTKTVRGKNAKGEA